MTYTQACKNCGAEYVIEVEVESVEGYNALYCCFCGEIADEEQVDELNFEQDD